MSQAGGLIIYQANFKETKDRKFLSYFDISVETSSLAFFFKGTNQFLFLKKYEITKPQTKCSDEAFNSDI